MPELKPYRGDYYLWKYIPSTPAAGIFTALFALGTVYIAWRMFKSRAWFCTAFIIGGLLEVVGYASRATARDQTEKLMPFVIQSTFILIAPALFAASVYMVLARVIRSVGAESLSIVPIRWLTKIFVCGDIVSFVVQASGAGIMVTADSMKTGENIILGGLFIQIVIFGLFALTAIVFEVRLRRQGSAVSLDRELSWKSTMLMLYVVSVLIMVRSIFRVIEYIMGNDGYPLRNEWTLYVFDACLMFGVVVAFGWRFPDSFDPRKVGDLEMEPSHGRRDSYARERAT
ncbi:RTA1 like protein-domain-containing protein [Dactylonectria estremocensis]|uniref:RTA1 like protein-domain-containing protein n=1 Tax=Dactylonectria estremocensis TaxID=1079267 RepID=A0A9P9IQN9_9HYPO|nr:RTA1 like protein-domain-containing protein [Dactylonectria estremocensis]